MAEHEYEQVAPKHQGSAPAPEVQAAGSVAAQRALEQRSSRGLDAAGMMQLQRTAGNAGVNALLDEENPVTKVAESGGNSLDPQTRQSMEQSIGADFSSVRVHTGGEATAAAKSVQAHAYTLGDDIVFQDGQYNPGTPDGNKMLAHELTHVVQQRSGPVDGTDAGGGVKVSSPDDRFEQAAEANAERVVSGDGPSAVSAQGAGGVQRAAVPEDEAKEEESVQTSAIQRAAAPEEEAKEEESVQTSAIQRAAGPEDEAKEEESMQA
jgi:hypothetical protein